MKKNIDKLTESEFEELLLTFMVGVYVRSGVLDSQGKNWKEVDDQLKFFLQLAEGLGFRKLVEHYNKDVLPNEKLCKQEEKIMEDYNEDEFWNTLEIYLGQRDFFENATNDDLEQLKKDFWLPDIVDKYYKKYEKEFMKHGINRLQIVNKVKK